MTDAHIPISQVARVSKGGSAAKPRFWRSLDELSDAEAMVKAMEADPSLYEAYELERAKR